MASIRDAIEAIISGTYTTDQAAQILEKAARNTDHGLDYLNHIERQRPGAKDEVISRLTSSMSFLPDHHQDALTDLVAHPDFNKPILPTKTAENVMLIVDPKYRKYSHDSAEFGKFSDELEKGLRLDKNKNHDLKAYLDHIGGSNTPIPNEVIYNAETIGKHERIEFGRTGDLYKNNKNIETLLKDKEKLEKKIAEATDPKKHKALQADMKRLDSKLADIGKESQKTASRTIDKLKEHIEDIGKNHEKAVEALEKHQRDVTEALERLEIKSGALDASKVTGLGGAEFTVKIDDGREFLIKEGKISNHGAATLHSGKPIDADTLEKIKASATDVLDKHVERKASWLEEAQGKHTAVIEDKIKHLEEHQTYLADKTKIGKSVEGATPSVKSIGTKLAEEKGIIGEAKYLEKGGVGRAVADVKANWHSGLSGKIKVLLGAGFVADGARRTIKGASALMSGDPEKQAEAGWGDVLVGVPEAVGGVLLARMGGKNHATGLGA